MPRKMVYSPGKIAPVFIPLSRIVICQAFTFSGNHGFDVFVVIKENFLRPILARTLI
jgi:hypothetical protein